MGLFQNTVIDKYLKSLDKQVVGEAYSKFRDYFYNTERQENIRGAKEEQFQEGFLRELFVKVLGYTLNPEPKFNLTTEYKNVKDSKKADGAILLDLNLTGEKPVRIGEKPVRMGEKAVRVVGIIELKGTDTTDLGKIENQAFSYKNNQPECTYVITSNFEKLRFYIDNAI